MLPRLLTGFLLLQLCSSSLVAQDATKEPVVKAEIPPFIPDKGDPKPNYNELRSKASYATGFEVGFSMCTYLKANECDDSSLYEGMNDALNGKSKMSAKEMRKLSEEYKASIFKARQAQKGGFAATVGAEMTKKGSYATGISLIEFYVFRENFRHEIDETELMKGFKAGVVEGRRVADDMLLRKTSIHAFEKLRDKRRAVEGKKHLAAGKKFLAENAARKDVITLPSGLQYRIIASTDKKDAESPSVGDVIKVHYRGKLIDGTEFDSSYKRGGPSTFPLTGNIKAWAEALPKMKIGDKWELFVPAHLGYGDKAQPPHIAANSVLIYEVELLGIQRRPKAK